MHRRAIISDVHGNLPALEAVLADIASQDVHEIVCLGDVCGYGPEPIECIKRIREKTAWSLLGNHDEAIYKEPMGFSSNAHDAIVWQRKLLDPAFGAPATAEVEERLAWLKSLAPMRKDGQVMYVHASPRDPLHEYVLKDDYDAGCGGPTVEAKANFELIDWLCFCGHSHRPGVVAEDFFWNCPEELNDYRYVLRPGFKTLVNVGSVGQPRDKHPESCYVLFDAPASLSLSPAQTTPPGNHNSSTVIMMRPGKITSAETDVMPAVADKMADQQQSVDEETRTESDPVLQEARKTVVMRMPKITFRRVPYDVAEASKRFFAVPELPKYNGVRLARGI